MPHPVELGLTAKILQLRVQLRRLCRRLQQALDAGVPERSGIGVGRWQQRLGRQHPGHPGDRNPSAVGQWQLPFREMGEFLPCVFSSRRPQDVLQMKAHLGNDFGQVRWLVGLGEKVQYMKAGAFNVVEVGDLCKVMAFGIDLANSSKKPVVLIADDICGFFAFVGSPAKWGSPWHGCRLGLSDYTARILAAMRQVAAPLGGVACCPNARNQLQSSEVSYCSFFTMDFMVFDPPLRFPVDFHPDVQHKLDYHVIASALAVVGAVCRLNRFSVHAGHYAEGGAGSRDARHKSDLRACRWLQRRWGAAAFRVNSRREAHVIFRACQLLERADMRLPALHRELEAASVPTQWSGTCDSTAIMAAIGAAARRAKGKAKAGAVCRGRSPWGKCAMTAAQRQRLHRARTALRDVVCELKKASGSTCDPRHLQAAGLCKRALSMAERQEVSRSRRARRASSGR